MLKFRRLLNERKLGDQSFTKVGEVFQQSGLKLNHIGVHNQSGLAHSALVTLATVHDKRLLPNLLHAAERRVYGDSAHFSQMDLMAQVCP